MGWIVGSGWSGEEAKFGLAVGVAPALWNAEEMLAFTDSFSHLADEGHTYPLHFYSYTEPRKEEVQLEWSGANKKFMNSK